jgi:hypothetical protein
MIPHIFQARVYLQELFGMEEPGPKPPWEKYDKSGSGDDSGSEDDRPPSWIATDPSGTDVPIISAVGAAGRLIQETNELFSPYQVIMEGSYQFHTAKFDDVKFEKLDIKALYLLYGQMMFLYTRLDELRRYIKKYRSMHWVSTGVDVTYDKIIRVLRFILEAKKIIEKHVKRLRDKEDPPAMDIHARPLARRSDWTRYW